MQERIVHTEDARNERFLLIIVSFIMNRRMTFRFLPQSQLASKVDPREAVFKVLLLGPESLGNSAIIINVGHKAAHFYY